MLGACAGAALAALAAVSCSSDEFESCEDSRTCPQEDAGAGGSAGVGGSDGGGAPGECETDEDCADEALCNGVERCVEGACQAGNPVTCLNVDREHCVVECVETDGSCRTTALDGDQDGHTAAACAAAPGDDCDDAEKTVYLGATELCDRLDNDCDSLIDLADGLTLSGSVQQIGVTSSSGRRAPAVAWSPLSSVYACCGSIRRRARPPTCITLPSIRRAP